MKTSQKIQRRDFLKISAMSGAALFIIGYLDVKGKTPEITNLSSEDSLGARMNAFIFIDSSGTITIYNHRPEMGQGTFESIPMIIAEELEADINTVQIMQSPASRKIYGDQMVVGSHSISGNFQMMRKIGASAKETLILAAANRWNVHVQDCYAKNATVIHRASGRKLSYGELAMDASKLQPPQNPKLKDEKDFTLIGTSPARKDIPEKTNGKAIFGIDCVVKGMLYASIERSPVFLGKLISYDDSKAKAVQGVRYVLKTQRNVWGHLREGVAVVADTYWAAMQGRNALVVKWDNGDLETWSTKSIKDDYKKAAGGEGTIFEEKGNFKNAFSSAAVKIEASYETPYQTHAPMEPMNAIVHAKKDSVEFWGSTQNPNGFRSQLAKQCAVPEEDVTIHYTYMGGGFGRRSLTDVPEEAADLSMKTNSPIQVIWSREDDLTQGPFRACSRNECKGALDIDGNLIALEHKVVCQEINNQIGAYDVASEQIAGGINTEYAIPNLAIKGVLRKFYIPISYWRSVYHSTNCFAHESFIDELAFAAKKDPLDFRLSLLKNHERYTAVLKAIADITSWHKPQESNSGKGVAIVERSGAFTAAVAEVARINGKMKVMKITVAIDCGIVVSPDTVKAQTEGCVVMGLTAAYKSGLTIDKGRVVEKNFHNYPILRINECPEIEVIVMKNNYQPEGAGEPGLPPVAPALTNAIFKMTGKRIRELPFNLDTL
ncbi:MAG TPA: molybdopterin cofactor-binding domain-containing protein [Puia sp.]|jgi:isoquinoline 1-oxidoreductase beta subunit|nr:molybdopterin cofactor-binding domain-containing protein [Puia sp.]